MVFWSQKVAVDPALNEEGADALNVLMRDDTTSIFQSKTDVETFCMKGRRKCAPNHRQIPPYFQRKLPLESSELEQHENHHELHEIIVDKIWVGPPTPEGAKKKLTSILACRPSQQKGQAQDEMPVWEIRATGNPRNSI